MYWTKLTKLSWGRVEIPDSMSILSNGLRMEMAFMIYVQIQNGKYPDLFIITA